MWLRTSAQGIICLGEPVPASPFTTGYLLQHAWAHQSNSIPPPLTEQHTCPVAKRFVSALTSAKVPKVKTVSLPTTAGTPTARVTTVAKDAQTVWSSSKLTHHYDTQFERELAHHPNKAFTLQLLTALQHGMNFGYKGPVGPNNAKKTYCLPCNTLMS